MIQLQPSQISYWSMAVYIAGESISLYPAKLFSTSL